MIFHFCVYGYIYVYIYTHACFSKSLYHDTKKIRLTSISLTVTIHAPAARQHGACRAEASPEWTATEIEWALLSHSIGLCFVAFLTVGATVCA